MNYQKLQEVLEGLAVQDVKNIVKYKQTYIILVSKKLDNGAYEPKKLQRDKVKEALLSFRRNLQRVGSECIESSLTTFEYV